MSDAELLRQQAEQIRASGVLGRPGALTRLFDYLLERSLAGEAPKEIEIAVHAFGKRPDFDVGQDSMVRVYVHKLRRRLEEYYARPGNAGQPRLTLPKGEYRLIAEAHAPDTTPSPVEPATHASRPTWRRPALLAAGFVLAMLIGAAIAIALMPQETSSEIRTARESIIWGPLLDDDLPITLVIGDYYLLGEEDAAGNISRLVREFFINSRADYFEHLKASPEAMSRYRDLGLTYLPVGAGSALQKLAPIVTADKPVNVVLVSELKGDALRSSHVVYVGYLSGLGMLGDSVFLRSRLSLGGSFDELVDNKTRATYMARGADSGNVQFTDYAYFATWPGPAGNRIVIVSGTRDRGLAHMAEALSDARFLADVREQVGQARGLEGLTQVQGMSNTNLTTRSIFVAPLKDTSGRTSE